MTGVKKRPKLTTDVYDLSIYGEEEFGPRQEKEKKRRKRRVATKKQRGDIILTFGKEKLSGERLYASDEFLDLLVGPIYAETVPLDD